MPTGYCGKILYVDLGAGTTRVEERDDRFYRSLLGGWGLVAQELLTGAPRGVEPLAPESPLVFATGVVTGAPIPGSGRHAVGAKSPLTGGFGEADAGGFWGVELKRAGFDAVVVTGQAQTPVFLWIKDGEAEILDAAHLWGRTTAEVQQEIHTQLGDPKIRVAQCGIAGENGVRFACIINELNRAAGRCGLGAVMGAKRLRAVAVRGSGTVAVADPDAARKIMAAVAGSRERWAGFHEHGTGGGVMHLNEIGRLPTRNFQSGTFEGAERISGTTMTETLLVGRDSCFACPIGCKRKVASDGAYKIDPAYGGPEYETLGAFGSTCGVDDLEAVAYANQLCNAYGMDTISCGVTIAWAMECFERGLLGAADTGGLDVRFGDASGMVDLVERIARRDGFGDVLAEGSLRAARRVGRDTERFVVHVKGQELPMHDPRFQFGLGIGYATSPTGADHMHNFHDAELESDAGVEALRPLGFHVDPLDRQSLPPEKAAIAAAAINLQVAKNCMGVCMFMPYRVDRLTDVLRAVCGWDMTALEVHRAGERALAMARLFNAREGMTGRDDAPPPRFAEPLLVRGENGGHIPEEELRAAIDLYCRVHGWDPESGAPTDAKLSELGIAWARSDDA